MTSGQHYFEKSSNEDEPALGLRQSLNLKTKYVDVLTNDSEEFDIFFALHAIKEVQSNTGFSRDDTGTLETLKTKQSKGPPGTGKTIWL